MFAFKGDLEASKSWMNRALVIQYFNKNIKLDGYSSSDDVVKLQKAIDSIGANTEFDLGLGGTTFRFFIFLISRLSGSFTLNADERLLQRPQQETTNVLKQFGVSAEYSNSQWIIKSEGWKKPSGPVIVSAELSSQFVSGLLLSAWNLNFDLEIQINKPAASISYLLMTVELLQKAGMQVSFEQFEKYYTCKIKPNQKAQVGVLEAELDMSSAFSLAAAAVVNGTVEITNWTSASSQPDLVFLSLFEKMGIKYGVQNKCLSITKHNNWLAIDFNLQNSPDLFPVLAVLTAFGEGAGKLSGAEQLKHKESDRIQKTKELLNLAGFKTELLSDGLVIFGQSSTQDLQKAFKFNPDHDHRMAMAAALLKLKGYNIQIENPEVVNKSYPAFWKHIGLQL